MAKKILSLKNLLIALKKERNKGRRIAFTNGCFDILHAGHVRYLKKARSFGDILVVGLNSDASVRKIKGKRRPIVGQKDRAEVLAALCPIDYIVLFNEPTPLRLIENILPDVLIKGADWAQKEIAGAEIVKRNKGRVVRITLARGRSTTNIIEKILSAHK